MNDTRAASPINLSMSTILALDDSATNLRMVQEILKGDYKVYSAPSGARALKFLEKFTPDLILLDIEMPEMDGYEVLRQLKGNEIWRDIPVIFMTGREDKESETRALELGAVDYIQKPLASDIVKARVKLHLELERYRRHLEVMIDQKTRQLSKLQETTLNILAYVVEFRDKETGGHINRTTNYVAVLMRRLREKQIEGYIFDEGYEADVVRSTKLHDIGKVGVPDSILLKPGRLTPEEFQAIKLHPLYGAQMLDNAIEELGEDSFLNIAREISISHHEKWDGSGYPFGLSGSRIPLSGRVMAIADVYDALISERPYKPPFTYARAQEIILEGEGTHFDPVIVSIFREAAEDFHQVTQALKD